jgi:hypothetical protein
MWTPDAIMRRTECRRTIAGSMAFIGTVTDLRGGSRHLGEQRRRARGKGNAR